MLHQKTEVSNGSAAKRTHTRACLIHSKLAHTHKSPGPCVFNQRTVFNPAFVLRTKAWRGASRCSPSWLRAPFAAGWRARRASSALPRSSRGRSEFRDQQLLESVPAHPNALSVCPPQYGVRDTRSCRAQHHHALGHTSSKRASVVSTLVAVVQVDGAHTRGNGGLETGIPLRLALPHTRNEVSRKKRRA